MTTYTIDGYRVVRKGLDWCIYKWSSYTPTKGAHAGEEIEDWVFQNRYCHTLGHALSQIYDMMLAEGRKDLKDVKSIRNHVNKLYDKLMAVEADERT